MEEAMGWQSPVRHKDGDPHAVTYSSNFLETRQIPKVKISKYRRDRFLMSVIVRFRFSKTKGYEIYCEYRPEIVWKKVGPMKWQLQRNPKHEWQKEIRYYDGGGTDITYNEEDDWRKERIWDNDCMVDWKQRTYYEGLLCRDTYEPMTSTSKEYYRECRTLAGNGRKTWQTMTRVRPRIYLGYTGPKEVPW